MTQFFRSRARSFRFAFAGLWYMIRTQPNAWIHATFTIAVIVLGLWIGLPPRDWAVLVLAIGIVWTAEFINTALEAAVDLASPKQHPLAKISKDVGAAAVLVAAASSVVVGLLILGPPLWQRILSILH